MIFSLEIIKARSTHVFCVLFVVFYVFFLDRKNSLLLLVGFLSDR